MKLVNCTTEYVNQTTPKYSARAQDGTQEMERNEASAKHVAWPSCAWLQLSLFPYPMGHLEHEHCTISCAKFSRTTLYCTGSKSPHYSEIMGLIPYSGHVHM